jgi:hypothetical protein
MNCSIEVSSGSEEIDRKKEVIAGVSGPVAGAILNAIQTALSKNRYEHKQGFAGQNQYKVTAHEGPSCKVKTMTSKASTSLSGVPCQGALKTGL